MAVSFEETNGGLSFMKVVLFFLPVIIVITRARVRYKWSSTICVFRLIQREKMPAF